jgi:2-keto-3-deoxy-L-rhamnonate aldolase RhmA
MTQELSLENPFRTQLSQGNVPFGTWLMSGTSSTAEAMGRAGFDWLLVDLEHVPVDDKDVLCILQAIAGTRASPVVRLASSDLVRAKRALDMGAQTLMHPFVNTPEEARNAVAYTKYPPEGIRGFAAMHRASGYGTTANYGKRANGGVFNIIQIETREAVSNLEAIAQVPGVDALFLGPGDLSAAMGHTGNIAHPEVNEVITDVIARCKRIGKPCGIVGPTPDSVNGFIKLGYDFVAIASDMGMMMRQANAFIEAVKPNLAKGYSSTVY